MSDGSGSVYEQQHQQQQESSESDSEHEESSTTQPEEPQNENPAANELLHLYVQERYLDWLTILRKNRTNTTEESDVIVQQKLRKLLPHPESYKQLLSSHYLRTCHTLFQKVKQYQNQYEISEDEILLILNKIKLVIKDLDQARPIFYETLMLLLTSRTKLRLGGEKDSLLKANPKKFRREMIVAVNTYGSGYQILDNAMYVPSYAVEKKIYAEEEEEERCHFIEPPQILDVTGYMLKLAKYVQSLLKNFDAKTPRYIPPKTIRFSPPKPRGSNSVRIRNQKESSKKAIEVGMRSATTKNKEEFQAKNRLSREKVRVVSSDEELVDEDEDPPTIDEVSDVMKSSKAAERIAFGLSEEAEEEVLPRRKKIRTVDRVIVTKRTYKN